MKQLAKIGFICALIISNNAFSIERVEGWYFGLLGEISHAPNSQFEVLFNDILYAGEVNLSPVGGGAGASVGYRISNFRLESELLFNINNYGELQINGCTFISPNVLGPKGCSVNIEASQLGFNGNTMGFYGLFNVYYDFLSSDSEKNFFPYVGLGAGGVWLRSHSQFSTNKQAIALGIAEPFSVSSDSSSFGIAAQGIIGVAWYLDSYTTIGLDFRYVSAFNAGNPESINNNLAPFGITLVNPNGTSQYGISTINLTATFALERGSS
ncbi:MAG: hypothetical protein HYX60_01545 [Legionella longbeachae]|nr:hypothetical protein [Legionella longbeachae]